MGTERFLKIRELFDRAVELPPDEREPFLREACGEEVDLFKEILLLLESHKSNNRFLSSPVEVPPSVFETSFSPPILRIGPYKVEQLLGRGGMGEVWRAIRDDGTFRKVVAIKIMSAESANLRFYERFLQERQLLAALDHPSIARILDGGQLEDGRPYAVMEYVEGQPLDKYCDEQQLNLDGRIRLIEQVCRAVEYLHANGVIHRDLKPANILVDSSGIIRLLDFGIAHITGAGARVDLTAPHERLLTPGYASPEQLAGEACTKSSDTYSIGALLYQLLVGCLPSPVAPTAPSAIIQKDLKEHPSDTWRIGQRLTADLDSIVLKSLEHNPALRYQSAMEMAEELKRFLSGQLVKAREYPLTEKVWKLMRRNRVKVAITAFMILLCAFGLWQLFRNWRTQMLAEDVQKQLKLVLDHLPATPVQNDVQKGVLLQLIQEVQKLRAALERMIKHGNSGDSSLQASRTVLLRRATGFLDQTASGASQSPQLALEIGRSYQAVAHLEAMDAGRKANKGPVLEHYAKAGYFQMSAKEQGVTDPDIANRIHEIERRVRELGGGLDELVAQIKRQFAGPSVSVSVNKPDAETVPPPNVQKATSDREQHPQATMAPVDKTPQITAQLASSPISPPSDWQDRKATASSRVQAALQIFQKRQEELASQGLSPNLDMVSKVKQMQSCLEMAEDFAKEQRWDDAIEYLSRAEAFAKRILESVGR